MAFSRSVCLFARICCLYLICKRWSGFGLLAVLRLGGEGEEEMSEAKWQIFAWRRGPMDEWRGEDGEQDMWRSMLVLERHEDSDGDPADEPSSSLVMLRGEGELAGDTTSQAT